MRTISSNKKLRKTYSIALKIDMIGLLQETNPRDLAKSTGLPHANLQRWKAMSSKHLAFPGNKKRKNLSGAGRPEAMPDSEALVQFMEKMRDEERALTCTHMIMYLKKHHRSWLDEYLGDDDGDRAYKSLLRLLERFCHRHGFTRQRPTKSKISQEDLVQIRTTFAAEFHKAFDGFDSHNVLNVDETAMYYDMPPNAIWSKRGKSAKISSGEKHSFRMTAVLTIRADGTKLPILFIMKGTSGGVIERTEFDEFPMGHYYAVQNKAWMDGRVWAFYLRRLLAPQIQEPSVLLLDNFDAHVSASGYKIASEEAGCLVAAIPPNATSAVQPLDVGIMAPFKRHLRSLWLQEDLIEGDDDELGIQGEDSELLSVTARQKRFAMIRRAIKAWSLITPQEIRHSFAKAIPSQ
jgi:hypothetical protein